MTSIHSAVIRRPGLTGLCFVLSGFLLLVAVRLLSQREYRSSAGFIPSQADASASGLALAASQFGIALPKSGDSWMPGVYVAVARSRAILEPIAKDSFTVDTLKRMPLSEILEVGESEPDKRLAETIRRLDGLIRIREEPKLGAIRIVVTTRWPDLSQLLAERLLESIGQFNISTQRAKAVAERQFVEGQVSIAQERLVGAEQALQRFLQRNRRIEQSPELQFERDRIQREVDLSQSLYNNLMRSLEEAKLREVRDTPVLSVIEVPERALVAEPRRLALWGASGAFIGFMLALVAYSYSRLLVGAKASGRSLVDEALHTLSRAQALVVQRDA